MGSVKVYIAASLRKRLHSQGTKQPRSSKYSLFGSLEYWARAGNPALVHAVTLLEAIDASARIHQLLPAGEEGMALGADFHLELALNRTALEGFTAGATYDAFTIIGMDVVLHLAVLHSNLLGAGRLAALLLHLAHNTCQTEILYPKENRIARGIPLQYGFFLRYFGALKAIS